MKALSWPIALMCAGFNARKSMTVLKKVLPCSRKFCNGQVTKEFVGSQGKYFYLFVTWRCKDFTKNIRTPSLSKCIKFGILCFFSEPIFQFLLE